jgi:hypothetical protein
LYVYNLAISLLGALIFITRIYAVEPLSNQKKLFSEGLPKDELLVSDINKQVTLKFKKEKNLCCIGSGAEMMYEIKMLSLSFNYYNEIDIAKGRELLVFAASEYLDAINTNVELRPYLDHWPFTANDIRINIGILKSTGKEVDLEKISFLSAEENMLMYYPKKKDLQRRTPLLTETYQQALQILEETTKQAPPTPVTKTNLDISLQKAAL